MLVNIRGNVMAMKDAKKTELKERRKAPLITPTDLGAKASADIAGGMNAILADVFALYLKTKNFHWHMSGPHFRDYHLLLDEQSDQIYAMTDPIAERIRKVGGTTLRSIGHIARLQRIKDNDADTSTPRTCWRSCARTTSHSLLGCAKCTMSWTKCVISPPRASSRTGSMRLSGACGFCSKRAAAPPERSRWLVSPLPARNCTAHLLLKVSSSGLGGRSSPRRVSTCAGFEIYKMLSGR